jgi:hypothetical protein
LVQTRRRDVILPAVMVAAVAVFAIGTADSESAAATCTTKRTTIAANSSAEVFTREVDGGYEAYGCDRRSRRISRLGTYDAVNGTGPRSFRLSGRFAAWDRLVCIKLDECHAQVGVADLRTGRKRSSTRTVEGATEATDLEVTKAGHVAWIRRVGDTPTLEIRTLDSNGETAIDSGSDIDNDSLAVSGNTLYWLRGGAPRSAELK